MAKDTEKKAALLNESRQRAVPGPDCALVVCEGGPEK